MRIIITCFFLAFCYFCCAQNSTPQTALKIEPVGTNFYRIWEGTGVATNAYARYHNAGIGSDSINKFVQKYCAWFTFNFEKSQTLSFTWMNADSTTTCGFNFLLYEFAGTGNQLVAEIKNGKLRPRRLAVQTIGNTKSPVYAGGLTTIAADTAAWASWQSTYLKSLKVKSNSQYYLVIQTFGLDGFPLPALSVGYLGNINFSLCFSDSCSLVGYSLQNLNFETGKSTLKGTNPQLDELAKYLKAHPTIKVRLIGHTDNTGTKAENDTLSLKRAQAVKKYIVARGANANQVETVGQGSSAPLVPNDSEKNKAINRRVELKFFR